MDCFWCGRSGASMNGYQVKLVRQRRIIRHPFHSQCVIAWDYLLGVGYTAFAKWSDYYPHLAPLVD